jgi:hypothetical protein
MDDAYEPKVKKSKTAISDLSDSDLGMLPPEILLKILTDYANTSLKDIIRCCRASREFKKEYCDTGVVYDRLFSRQYGSEKRNHAIELLKPYNISPLNRLLAYRLTNLPPDMLDHETMKFRQISINDTDDSMHIFLDTKSHIMQLHFFDLSTPSKNAEKVFEKIKSFTRYLKNPEIINFDDPDEFGPESEITLTLKHFSNLFDVLFLIYANSLEMFGGYYRPNEVDSDEDEDDNDDAIFLGCNLCGSVEISGTCGDCQQVNYCGRGCQEKDFTKHQKECSKIKKKNL